MSQKSDGDSSSSSSSEDEEFELNEEFEKDFLKTLSSLKNKDPSIYDEKTNFFSDKSKIVAGLKSKKLKKDDETVEKPFTIAEFEKKHYFNEDAEEDNETHKSPPDTSGLSYVEEQRQLKESFKSFLKDDSDESDSGEDLLKKYMKTAEEKEKEEADYIQWLKGQKDEIEDKDTQNKLKPLFDYWNANNLDQGEAFLRDYILNKRFLANEKSDDESSEEEAAVQSDDSTELKEIEEFEHKFNSRFEDEEAHADLIKRYPRTIEGSLRRKSDKRKRKRAEIHERKEKEKKKKREEINKQKNIKSREIQEKLEELKKLTGNDQLAFKDEDILEDFNSEEFDKKMSSMYDEQFYSLGDSEKPRIDDIEGLDEYGDDEGYNENVEDINMDCEAGPSYKEKKLTRTRKKKDKKKKSFTDFSLLKDKPTYNPEFHESYNKFMDEYYQLDCEDFIGDMPTKFKYREVEPNDFGLSVEEILLAEDKELNAWSSTKKLTKLRPNHVEKNEAMIYKKKAENEELKRKLLPSLFSTKEEKESDEVVQNKEENSHADTSSESQPKKKKKRKPWFKPDREIKKKPSFHESRLAAYGINPKKFKSK